MSFIVTVDHRGDTEVVRVIGDVDIYTAPVLDEELQKIVADGSARVAVDLHGCSYFDSEGIKALVKAYRAMEGRSRLQIIGARGSVLRVFKISGLEMIFDVVSDLDLPCDD